MVAKKLVKCKELREKKGDGVGEDISRLLTFFFCSIFFIAFFSWAMDFLVVFLKMVMNRTQMFLILTA